MDSDSLAKLKENVLAVLRLNPDGVQQKTFEEKIPNLKLEYLLMVITDLIGSSQIEQIKNKNSKDLFLRLKSANILSLEKKLKNNEIEFNQIIRDAGSKGISPETIVRSLKMQKDVVMAMEKRLVEVGLIKIFYFNSKKVYVAVDVVPDSNLSERLYVMDDKKSCEERIEELQSQVLGFLKMKFARATESTNSVIDMHRAANVTIEAVSKYVNDSGKKISDKEIRLVLDSLVFSKDVTRLDQSLLIKAQSSIEFSAVDSRAVKVHVYRFRPKRQTRLPSVASVPCSACPHKEYCTPGKAISPENCEYLEEFLYKF